MWADGGRRKWWRKWRCPIVCVRTLCNGLLPCGSGGCRSGAASLSGGKSGRCRAAAGPLHSPPPFNGAAAVKCFLLSSSLLFSSCMVSNENKNNTELQFSICILLHWCSRYRVALIGRGLIKVLHFNYSKFCCPNREIRLCFLRDKLKHLIAIVFALI